MEKRKGYSPAKYLSGFKKASEERGREYKDRELFNVLLELLAQHGPMTASELAARALAERSQTARVIETLVDSKLATVGGGDPSNQTVQLTDRGKDFTTA